jgi:hypothetical protein
MLKRLLIILSVSCLIVAFSHLAWASVEGSWHVQGTATTKVSAKGHGTKTMKGDIDDIWTFLRNGDFATENIGGSWSQKGRKIIVNLNADDVTQNFEEMLSEELETDISVEAVTKMTFSGTEQKNGSIKGSFKIYMNIYSGEYDLHGKSTVSGSFKGTRADQGEWIQNPANGHSYKLTPPVNWQRAEALAVEWGGHLVTINDREEELWIRDNFGSYEYFWTGLNDMDEEGQWKWVNGEPVTYTNWWPGEPNNEGAEGEPEDAMIMNWGGGWGENYYYGDGWNDNSVDNEYRGIVELLHE